MVARLSWMCVLSLSLMQQLDISAARICMMLTYIPQTVLLLSRLTRRCANNNYHEPMLAFKDRAHVAQQSPACQLLIGGKPKALKQLSTSRAERQGSAWKISGAGGRPCLCHPLCPLSGICMYAYGWISQVMAPLFMAWEARHRHSRNRKPVSIIVYAVSVHSLLRSHRASQRTSSLFDTGLQIWPLVDALAAFTGRVKRQLQTVLHRALFTGVSGR